MEMLILLFLLLIFILLLIIVGKQHEQNNLMKAGVFLRLYEKIHKDASFRRVENILENSEDPDFQKLIENEKENFEEYLRFFDSVVLAKIPNHLSKPEADLLFSRPAELLKRHHFVRNYIATGNYKNLDAILKVNSEETKSLS